MVSVGRPCSVYGALMRRFAEPFGADDLAAALGLAQHAGNASYAWQAALARVADKGGPVGEPHKGLGAELLFPRTGSAALAVLGHHGGLGGMKSKLCSGESST
jgi:CRISPR-associated endonuclease/helicase Cas3